MEKKPDLSDILISKLINEPTRPAREERKQLRNKPKPEESLFNLEDRPDYLTQDKLDSFFRSLRGSIKRSVAARAAGIEPRLVSNWLEKGYTQTSGFFFEFKEEVLKAEAVSQVKLQKNLVEAAKDPRNWKAATYLLEKLYPQEWGDAGAGEDSGNLNAPEVKALKQVDDGELMDLLALPGEVID